MRSGRLRLAALRACRLPGLRRPAVRSPSGVSAPPRAARFVLLALALWLVPPLAPAAQAQNDITAPTLDTIQWINPTTSPTNADTLTWQLRFSEGVQNVDDSDFELIGGPTPPVTLTVTAVAGGTILYEVSMPENALANLDGEVTLSVKTTHDIEDLAGNPLTNRTPMELDQSTYELDHTAPTVTKIERHDPATSPTNANELTWRVTFNEDMRNVGGADFTVNGTTAMPVATPVTVTGTVIYDVTVAGGDLANLERGVTLSFKATHDIEDLAGNALTNRTPTDVDESDYELDNTAPTVSSIVRHDPATTATTPTNANELTWRVTFSEEVTGVDDTDFRVLGAGNVSDRVTAISGSIHDVTVSRGEYQ